MSHEWLFRSRAVKRPGGRLFWKMAAALWLTTMASFAIAVAYLRLMGFRPEDDNHKPSMVPIILSLGVSLGFSAYVAWYLSGPLRHLRWGIRRASEGHLDTRVSPLMGSRRDEVVDLAIEFDLMAERLQLLTEHRQKLLYDISHELRSPLARMQVALGLFRQNPESGIALAARTEREVLRLDALIDELLTLHRLEAAATTYGAPLAKEALPLRDVLNTIVADATFEANAVGCTVLLTCEEPTFIHVHADLIYRALQNVVRNAVRFTPPGGQVAVNATPGTDRRTVVIEVADQGPGVPSDKLTAIFEPFIRLPSSTASHGSGLGLALAKHAIECHGGHVEAALRAEGGLLVRITLPYEEARVE